MKLRLDEEHLSYINGEASFYSMRENDISIKTHTIYNSGKCIAYNNSAKIDEKYCHLVHSIVFDENVTSIRANAFRNCYTLSVLDLSKTNITSIEDYAFADCVNLENINLSNVTSVGTRAFWNCRELKVVKMPNVTSIGKYVFDGLHYHKLTIVVGNSNIAEQLRKEYPNVEIIVE